MNNKGRYFCLLLSWQLFIILPVSAQLTAGFQPDKTGGCAPLTVSFTNTTYGAGPNVTYTWDLGNGNFSYNTSATATYTEEKTYTVQLTATENGKTSVATMQVTVARKPVANFTVSAPSGCIPFGVTFTSTSTPGDGTLSSFVWEYGDGYADQLTSPIATHTYIKVMTPSVTLTVVNSYGCAAAVHKDAVTEVLPALTSAFTADKAVLCTVNDAVAFTNTSSGPGILSYAWDFGDGKTETSVSPGHVYGAKGEYWVKLTTSNNKGCSQTTTLPTQLNVAAYTADFSTPPLICTDNNNYYSFNATTYPYSYNTDWTFSDGYTSSYSGSVYRNFTTGGNQTVKLKALFGNCPLEVTKTIVINTTPVLNGFEVANNAPCGAPSTVQLKDTSSWAVSWSWQMNDYPNYGTSTAKAPSYTYRSDGGYGISLRAKDIKGCEASAFASIYIGRPFAYIYTENSTADQGGATNCGPFTISFKSTATNGTIASFKWNFADGTTATDAEPRHTFSRPGSYGVTLSYVTDQGCTGTTTPALITVYQKPAAAFSGNTTVCGNTNTTYFSNNAALNYSWLFYDVHDNVMGYGGSAATSITFSDTGLYSVRMIAYNGYDPGCSDTLYQKDYIHVLDPFVGSITAMNTCNGKRDTISFTESSRRGEKWEWDFGDGSTLTTTQQTGAKHVYAATGSYNVTMAVTKGNCRLSTGTQVQVLLKQKPSFSATKNSICNTESLDIRLDGYEVNPRVSYVYDSYYYFTNLEYEDGTSFTGSNQNTTNQNYYWRTYYTGRLSGLVPGKTKLRAITNSASFGCADTSNYIPIQVNGPVPGFKVVGNNVCYKATNIIEDTTKASNSNTIARWDWSFGDGQVESFTTPVKQIRHTYPDLGTYYVTLRATDNQGCTSTTSGTATVAGPKADLYYSPSMGTPKNTVYVYNNTSGNQPIEYKWTFSNSKTTYTDYMPPVRTYTKAPDTDTIRLMVHNPDSGCRDTAVKVLPVVNMNTDFTMNTSFLHSTGCLPVFVRFTNISYNTTGVIWDFGDGTTLEDLTNQNRNPGHIYREPGVYKVILYGFNDYLASKDTTVDSVVIRPAATANIESGITESCTAKEIGFTSNMRNAASFSWDFGDGVFSQGTGNTTTHTYIVAGLFQAAIALKNADGCPAAAKLAVPILIDSLNVQIRPQPTKICDSGNVVFNPVVRNLGADKLGRALYYHWDFGTLQPKDTANTAIPSFYYNRQGNYTIKVKVTSQAGCVKEASEAITVITTPQASIAAMDEICAGESVSFKGNATPANNVSWKWDFANGATATDKEPAIVYTQAKDSYKVRLIADNSGCADTAFHELAVHPLPMLQPLQDTTAVIGSVIPLRTAGSADITRWSWQPSATIACPTCAATTATPLRHTRYEVAAYTRYGCSATASFYVKLLCAETPIFIPNTFTPNKDGRNDLFYPRGKGVRQVAFFRIYNRLGEMIFERRNFTLNDPSQGWDGTYLGKPLQNGVFAYTSDMVCDAGETFSIKGNVMLIR